MKPQCASPGAPRRVRPLAAPFPPLGPPRRVPQLPRYYDAVRLPVPLSPRFVAFAWRYPASRLSFRSLRSRTPNRGPGVQLPVPTSGQIRREASRASQVPGQPTVPMPCSSTPAGPNTPGHCGMSAWPPLCPQRRLPRITSFRGSMARPWDALFTLRPMQLPAPDAKLASGRWPGATGRDWLPAGLLRKVSDDVVLLSRAYPGARSFRVFSGGCRLPPPVPGHPVGLRRGRACQSRACNGPRGIHASAKEQPAGRRLPLRVRRMPR